MGLAVGPRHGMPTVWVQQLGPGLYVDSRSPHAGQLRTPPCAFAIGLSVAPVGRVPEAMHPPQNGTAFGMLGKHRARVNESPGQGVAACHPSYSAPCRAASEVMRARARAVRAGERSAVVSVAATIHVQPPSRVSMRVS